MIIDRLTKSALFLLMKIIDYVDKLVTLHVNEVVRLHEIPIFIVPDRESSFTSRLWSSIQHALNIKFKALLFIRRWMVSLKGQFRH